MAGEIEREGQRLRWRGLPGEQQVADLHLRQPQVRPGVHATERAAATDAEPTGVAHGHLGPKLDLALEEPADVPDERGGKDGAEDDQDQGVPAAGVVHQARSEERTDRREHETETEEGKLGVAGRLGATDQVSEVVRNVVRKTPVI